MFANSMLAAFMSALAFVMGYPYWKKSTGLREWGSAMISTSGAFLLFSLAGRLPFFLTFFVANSMLVIGLTCAVLAHARHFQTKASTDALMLLSAIGIGGVTGVFFFEVPRVVAIVAMSVFAAGQMGMLAYLIHKNTRPLLSGMALFSKISIAGAALSFSWRAMAALSGDSASVTPVANSALQLSTHLVGGLFITVTSVCFVGMVEERQRREFVDREVARSELAILRAQIEPHFLWNTLAHVQYLTRKQPEDAETMMGHLIRFLRSAVPRSRGKVSTLGMELESVEAYLELMKIRMGPRLTANVEMDRSLSEVSFPPLLIQTLVENAIKHGIEPKVGTASVTVSAKATSDGERLVIEVTDDGVGLQTAPATQGTGMGLKSVRERIQLLYGSGAALFILGAQSGGVTARMEMPFPKSES
jgi:sensor histidine kinase YesM